MTAFGGLLPMQAQAAPAQGQDFSFFLMLGGIFLIFYFLVLRPQQKKQRGHEESLKGIERGDEIVNTGGIHGKVVGVADDVLTVEIGVLRGGDRMRIKLQRARVESVTKAKDEKAGKKLAEKADKVDKADRADKVDKAKGAKS